MKIQIVIFAAILCSYVQTVNTGHDEEFIDPTDMEHYDQSTKSLKVTLKERESYTMFKGLLQRLLESAERCGLVDEKNHYDAEVILTRQAHAEISNFLNDKPCDPDVVQKYLNTFLVNFKKHNEDEWKLKFEEFFQMDITKVKKLRIIEDMFKKHFERILKNTKKTGQPDEENHYDTELILTRKAHEEISTFLQDKPCDPEVVREHLNTILINFKIHNEDEWKLKFEEFFKMDITKVEKLRTTEELLKKHFKKILEKVQNTDQRTDMEGKINDVEMEINKFLSDEDWDQAKLEIILENVTVNKDEGNSFWMYFWTLFLVCVTSYLLKWIKKRFYSGEPDENVETLADDGYHEDPISLAIPETRESIVIQNFRSVRQSEPSAERDRVDESQSQSSKMSHTLTQEENEDESYEEDNIQAHTDDNLEQNPEYADMSNAEEPSLLRAENVATERVRSEIQAGPGRLQDDYFALKKTLLNINQESFGQTCGAEEVKQRSPSPNVEESKHKKSLETNQRLSHVLLLGNERQELANILQNDGTESVRSEIQTQPAALRDENLYSDAFLQNSDQIDDQECHELESLSEEQSQHHSLLGVVEIKDENSANQAFSGSLPHEKEQLGATPDVNESTDLTNCNQELLPCDTEAASEEKVDMATVIDAYHLQDTSMNEDEESDYIVINESAPESLTFLQDEEHE